MVDTDPCRIRGTGHGSFGTHRGRPFPRSVAMRASDLSLATDKNLRLQFQLGNANKLPPSTWLADPSSTTETIPLTKLIHSCWRR